MHVSFRRILPTLAILVPLVLLANMATAAPAIRLVKDISPGERGGKPEQVTPVGDTLFLAARTPETGRELWRSDGTEAGTVMVKDIRSGPKGSLPPTVWLEYGAMSRTAVLGSTMYFWANDDVHSPGLWKTDGTADGTTMVKDFGGPGWGPLFLTAAETAAYFLTDDGVHGLELWTSDGTGSGTRLVKDIVAGPDSSFEEEVWYFDPELTALGDTIFFVPAEAGGLWRSDGTEAGTVMVKDIRPEGLTAVGDTLFFFAGHRLWKSDGTEAGTVMVEKIGTRRSPWPSGLTDAGGTLYFAADDGTHGTELWRSDGTETGTVMVKDILPGPDGSGPYHLTDEGGTLCFSADDGVHGDELMRSDGTKAGTVVVKDIRPGRDGSYLYGLTDVEGTLYFGADDGAHGYELWRSDGTKAGTVMVQDLNRGERDSTPFAITDLGGTTVFSAKTASTGRELWTLAPGSDPLE